MSTVNRTNENQLRQELIGLEHKRYERLKAGDFAGLGEFLADEYLHNHVWGGQILSKASFLETIKGDDLVVKDVTISEPDVRFYGDCALVSGIIDLRITLSSIEKRPVKENETEQIRYYRYLDVWAKKDDSWKLVARQATNRQPPTIVGPR